MNAREQDAHVDPCQRLVTALNERDAARAEAERLRSAMERARDSCLHHATGKCFSIDDEHVCVEAEQDAFYDAAMWLTAALRPREDVLRDARIAEAAPRD